MRRWNVVTVSDAADVDQIEADDMEIDFYGTLIFRRRDEVDKLVIVHAYAHGEWRQVERVTR